MCVFFFSFSERERELVTTREKQISTCRFCLCLITAMANCSFQWTQRDIIKPEALTLSNHQQIVLGLRFHKIMVFKYFPGGYSIYPWVGRCGTAPHTLTLFKTNIADFPTLFKTEFRFLIPCLRHLTRILINKSL